MEKISVKIYSRKIEAFTKDEILSMIPRETLEKIKSVNEHPFFQAYSICHDGVSTPTILGDTARPISWTKKAIQSIRDIATKGIKFFFRHNQDNSTDNRQELGEIVADFQKEIDGKLHHIAIGYFPDKEKVKDMDICSQEAEWSFLDTAAGWVADKIESLTGIALSKSTIEKPAFDGAIRLGMIQAFEPEKIVVGETIKEDKRMTFEEIKKAVKEMNIFPNQLYSIDDIKNDREIGKVFNDLEKDLNAKKEELKTFDTKVKELTRKTLQVSANERLNNVLKSVAVTDKQKTFIERKFKNNFDKFDEKTLEDEGIKKFVNEKLEDYKDNADFFGETEKTKLPSGESGNESNEKDYTKAANNEFLQTDIVLNN